MKCIVSWILNPRWVAFVVKDGQTELGIKIWGITFALYKADVYMPSNITYSRRPLKREFGESLHPVNSDVNILPVVLFDTSAIPKRI